MINMSRLCLISLIVLEGTFMQTTGYFLRTLRNRCRTWLTRAAALVALCSFGIAGAQMVDMQELDNAPPHF